MPETKGKRRLNKFTVFVHACGQPNGIGEIQTEKTNGGRLGTTIKGCELPQWTGLAENSHRKSSDSVGALSF
jgi:hypothetical protein